tara:strand:+ start:4530 stop:5381 length:852 start_codon:yes stop_codon:yes gene_type:complete
MGKSNILIVGSNSLVGKSLKSLNLLSGFDIYKTSRSISKDVSNNFIEFDLKRNENKKINIDFEWCIYLADLDLIDGLLNEKVKFKNLIAFSTSSVLTKIHSSHKKDQKLVERFQNAEEYTKKKCIEKGIQCFIFRPTMIYSIGSDQNITVISNFIKKYKFFPRIGSYSGLRQPVSSDCLAKLISNVIDSGSQLDSPESFQVAGKETMTFEEMIIRIFKYNRVKPIFIPVNKAFFGFMLKILKYFGFLQNISFEMIDHASMDFNFDISEVIDKFNFNPKEFLKS